MPIFSQMTAVSLRIWITLAALAAGLALGSGSVLAQSEQPSSPPKANRPTEDEQTKARVEEIRVLLDGIVSRRDLADIPKLIALLDDPDDRVQAAAMRILVGVFPEKRLEVFDEILASGSASAKECVHYGLGLIPDAEAEKRLLSILGKGGVFSRGLAGGVTALLKDAAIRVNNHVVAGAEDPPVDSLARFHRLQQALVSGKLSDPPLTGESLDRLLLIAENYAQSVQLLEAYTKDCDPALARALRRLRSGSRHWLGPIVPPDYQSMRYTFCMDNIGVNKKDFPVAVEPADFDPLRYRQVKPERSVHWRVLLDGLVAVPSAHEPRLVEIEGKGAVLEYSNPLRAQPEFGMGAFNVFYWLGKVDGIARCRVELEEGRGVPLVETWLDAEGKSIGQVEYRDYVSIADDSWAPARIIIETVPTNIGKPMRYEFDYELRDGRFWGLVQGRALEKTPDGSVLRATAALRDVSIELPKKPETTSRPR